MKTSALTRADLLNLPATTDIVTAGRAFGLGRTTAYQLAKDDAFPVKVLRIGGTFRVVTADLLRALRIDPTA